MAGTRGNHLLAVYVGIPSDIEEEFNKWYNTQHVPERIAIAGFQSAARYVSLEGTPKYMAVYHLTEPAVQTSPPWQKAIDTPWSARSREAFRNRWRTVYKPIE